MKFRQGKSMGNDWESGAPAHWDWSKNGGDEFKDRDFFSVHWEVNYPKGMSTASVNEIRLHVSSPRYADDAELNEIKQGVVEALTSPSLLHAVQQRGYQCRSGSRTSTELVKKNRGTEPLRVILLQNQLKSTHKENLQTVHDAVGDIVNEVVERFAPQLSRRLDRHS
jgi:hypothetical protein